MIGVFVASLIASVVCAHVALVCPLSNGASVSFGKASSLPDTGVALWAAVSTADGDVAYNSTGSFAGSLLPLSASWTVAASSGNQKVTLDHMSPVAGFATGLHVACDAGALTAVANVTFAGASGFMRLRFEGDTLSPFVTLVADATALVPLPAQGSTSTVVDALRFRRSEDELLQAPIYGLGTQYNTLDLRGWTLPVFTREQGVGRGAEPVTSVLNADGRFAGGSARTTYGARPVYIGQPTGITFAIADSVYSEFAFRSSGVIDVFVNASSMTAKFWRPRRAVADGLGSASPLAAAVQALSKHVTGLPPKLAPWAYDGGAVIGMQGGTAAVLSNLSALEELGCPVSAFWLQDWTGVRQLSMRQGLWWNWRWSDAHYPNHEDMVATLAFKAIRVLTYINPMLADCGPAANCSGGVNLHAEALARDFLVRHGPRNELWAGYNGAALVDLTNPAARAWFAEDVVAHAFRTGVRGFMADFGEAYPLDANTSRSDAGPAAAVHNAFPDLWFGVARDGATLGGLAAPESSFFFGRSAWLRSGALYSSAWQGDQLCAWGADDGLQSAVTSLLAAGLSGTPFTHSDIGGYNAYTELGIRRTPELFYRWCELAAFTTTMRTHDGSNPHANWQFYSSNASRAEFTRNVKLYRALAPVRTRLVAEAEATWLPVVRPVIMQFADAAATTFGNMTQQFALGSIVVAPVTEPNATHWTVHLPVTAATPCWASLWAPATVNTTTSPVVAFAPIGCPPAWFPCGDPEGVAAARSLNLIGLAARCRR